MRINLNGWTGFEILSFIATGDRWSFTPVRFWESLDLVRKYLGQDVHNLTTYEVDVPDNLWSEAINPIVYNEGEEASFIGYGGSETGEDPVFSMYLLGNYPEDMYLVVGEVSSTTRADGKNLQALVNVRAFTRNEDHAKRMLQGDFSFCKDLVT